MHVVADLSRHAQVPTRFFWGEALSSETNKGYVTIPELKYKELKKSLLQMHLPLPILGSNFMISLRNRKELKPVFI